MKKSSKKETNMYVECSNIDCQLVNTTAYGKTHSVKNKWENGPGKVEYHALLSTQNLKQVRSQIYDQSVYIKCTYGNNLYRHLVQRCKLRALLLLSSLYYGLCLCSLYCKHRDTVTRRKCIIFFRSCSYLYIC